MKKWTTLKKRPAAANHSSLVFLSAQTECSREDSVEGKSGLLVILTREVVERIKTFNAPGLFGGSWLWISFFGKLTLCQNKDLLFLSLLIQTHLNSLLSLSGMTVSEASNIYQPIAPRSSWFLNTGALRPLVERCLQQFFFCIVKDTGLLRAAKKKKYG